MKYTQNQQEILDLMQFESSVETAQAKWILIKFFQENVCIPRGENRHRFADIIHQKLENIDLEILVCQDQNKWAGFVTYTGLDHNDEFKLKEDEPEPKFKVGEKVIVKSNFESFESTIIKIDGGRYFFEDFTHLPIHRQDAQMFPIPVYEWQYEYKADYFTIITDYMTDEELIRKRDTHRLPKHCYIKKPESKRERK